MSVNIREGDISKYALRTARYIELGNKIPSDQKKDTLHFIDNLNFLHESLKNYIELTDAEKKSSILYYTIHDIIDDHVEDTLNRHIISIDELSKANDTKSMSDIESYGDLFIFCLKLSSKLRKRRESYRNLDRLYYYR